MEPTTIFLAAVALIGVSHLATTLTKGFRKNRRPTHQASSRQRSDWYCFFKCADLYGSTEQTGQPRASQKTYANNQQRRPRIYT